MESALKAFSRIAVALVAVLSASPANAKIAVWARELTPRQIDADQILVSADYEVMSVAVCDTNFTYVQRMTIPGGPSMMVLTDTLYTAGNQDLYLSGMSCEDGYLLFG